MKTFSELRQEIEEAIAKRQAETDITGLTESDLVALQYVNYQVNGVNKIPSNRTMSEFTVNENKDGISVKGGFGSFSHTFRESDDYPPGVNFDAIKKVLI